MLFSSQIFRGLCPWFEVRSNTPMPLDALFFDATLAEAGLSTESYSDLLD